MNIEITLPGPAMSLSHRISSLKRAIALHRRHMEKMQIAGVKLIQSEFDLGRFDYPFFNQWGGLPARHELFNVKLLTESPIHGGNGEYVSGLSIAPSPLYAREGGEQPVPDNIEVAVKTYDQTTFTAAASEVVWSCAQDKLFLFKITGRVMA